MNIDPNAADFDVRLFLDLSPDRGDEAAFIPPPPWTLINEEEWGGYAGMYEAMTADERASASGVLPIVDGGAVCESSLVTGYRAVLEETAGSCAARRDAIGEVGAFSARLFRLAKLSGDGVVVRLHSIVSAAWTAAVRHEGGQSDHLDALVKAAGAPPLSQCRAALTPRELAKSLVPLVRLHREHGAIDVRTMKHVKPLTRWQIARFVLAPRLYPLIDDAALRMDDSAVAERVYARMPLVAEAEKAHGNATDKRGAERDEPFDEDPQRVVAAAFRAVGVDSKEASEAVRDL